MLTLMIIKLKTLVKFLSEAQFQRLCRKAERNIERKDAVTEQMTEDVDRSINREIERVAAVRRSEEKLRYAIGQQHFNDRQKLTAKNTELYILIDKLTADE